MDWGRDTGVGTGATPEQSTPQLITRPLLILRHARDSYGITGVRDELALSNSVSASIGIVNATMQDRPVLIDVALKHHSAATLNKARTAVCSTSGLMFY